MTFPSGLPWSPPITLATCEHLTRESEAARPVSSAQARLPPLKCPVYYSKVNKDARTSIVTIVRGEAAIYVVHAFTAHHQHEDSERLSPGPGFNLRDTGPEIR